MKILDLLLPREVAFFKYMNEQVDVFCQACQDFRDMVNDISKLSEDEIHLKVSKIGELEMQGDQRERFIIRELHRTFITPLDREDIHSIVISIDKSLDILNDVSLKFEIYRIRTLPINVMKFANIIVDISIDLKRLINNLESKKDLPLLLKKMHRLENDGDQLFRMSMAELFTGKNPIEIIKFKEIYEHLEDVVNSVEYIAKLVRGIMVKQG
jgi:uncharacterized protein